MLTVKDKMLRNVELLYPSGRAFRMGEGSWRRAFHSGLADSDVQAYHDIVSIMTSAMPDNSDFDANDASNWERALGMVTNGATPIATRRAAILQRLSQPGINPAKSHYLNLEKQLQDAGFNVYVHENIPVQSPGTLNPSIISQTQYGQFQYGQKSFGGYVNNKVANHFDETIDFGFNFGSNLKACFFVGGSTLGTYANVSASRKNEFRQMIIRLKPVQNVGILFINYI